MMIETCNESKFFKFVTAEAVQRIKFFKRFCAQCYIRSLVVTKSSCNHGSVVH